MRPSFIRCIAAIAALCLAACSSPTQEWASARVTLNATEDTLVRLHDAGILSDEELVGTGPIILPARAALDEAEGLLPAGGPAFDILIRSVESGIARLEELEKAKQKGR